MFDYFYGQSGEMFSYFRVPKILFRDIKFKDLSTDAKTLYGILTSSLILPCHILDTSVRSMMKYV